MIINNKDEDIRVLEGKSSSFWELIGENPVVIPIIQRDYAQGRENDDVRQIRSKFIKQLLSSLKSGTPVDLDFVYGSLEEPNKMDKPQGSDLEFTPLDGQQRLTTLFLLHFFLALWNDDDYEVFKKHVCGRFSYKTRASSTDFCKNLISCCNPKSMISEIAQDPINPVSRSIENEGWFHIAWQNDPTVKGMLVMLDAICKEFKPLNPQQTAKELFIKLRTREEDGQMVRPVITFNLLYLNRGKVRLSDELYIKMNSRGKPLSDFETFKARFETFIRKETDVNSKDFSQKIDHEWADTFWSIRNDVLPKSCIQCGKQFSRENTDAMMMNLIKTTIASEYASHLEETSPVLEVLFETEVAKKRQEDLHLTYYRYSEELGVLNERARKDNNEEGDANNLYELNCKIGKAIYNTFQFIHDFYGEKYNFDVDKNYLDAKRCVESVLFYNIDGDKDSQYSSFSYGDRLLFYGYSQYCIRNRDQCLSSCCQPNTGLDRWMRFVRNMAEAVEINRTDEMRRVFKVMDSILRAMQSKNVDICEYLDSLNENPEWSPFPVTQIREEILKSKLIRLYPEWEKEISLADNTKEWPGRSGYLMYYSGVSSVGYQKVKELSQEAHKRYLDSFILYRDKMSALLYSLDTDSSFKEHFLLERSLLSKGNYFRKESDGVYSMMDVSVSGRSYSWRQMVQYNGISGFGESDTPVKDSTVYSVGVDCLKLILDDQQFSVISCKDDNNQVHNCVQGETLEKIISSSLSVSPDWRTPMLEDFRLWDNEISQQRYLWLDENTGRARIPRKRAGKSSRRETNTYRMFLMIKDIYASQKEDKKHPVECCFQYQKNADPDGIRLVFNIGDRKHTLCIEYDSGHSCWRFYVKAYDDNDNEINADPSMQEQISEALRIPSGQERTCSSRDQAIKTAIILRANIKTKLGW